MFYVFIFEVDIDVVGSLSFCDVHKYSVFFGEVNLGSYYLDEKLQLFGYNKYSNVCIFDTRVKCVESHKILFRQKVTKYYLLKLFIPQITVYITSNTHIHIYKHCVCFVVCFLTESYTGNKINL